MKGEDKIGGGDAPAASATVERLIRLPEVMALTGRGRTVTLDDVKAGRFPSPIKAGRATLWALSEVQAWIAERIRAHRGSGR